MRHFDPIIINRFPLGFNPRIRKGCDMISQRRSFRLLRFNPRIRKGCDIVQQFFNFISNGFNPRIRKGCDRY